MDMAEQPLSNGLINSKQQLVEEHEMALCEVTELNDQLELALCEATELAERLHDCEISFWLVDDQEYPSPYWDEHPHWTDRV